MLEVLILLNLVASGSHFAHNGIFLESYPGPPWVSRPVIVVVWVLIAAVLLLGYGLYRRGHRVGVFVACGVYGGASLLGLGHYMYGPPSELSAVANLFIVLEGAASVILLTYLAAHLIAIGRP